MPIGVVESLLRRRHAEKDEVVDLALFLRLHPLVGVEGSVRAIAARNLARDFAGQIGDFKSLNPPDSAFTGEEALPCRLNPAG